MYGLILTNLSEYIISVYGEEKWETIRKSAGCAQSSFGIHQVYPDGLIPKLGAKACKILEITEREMYEGMGKFFVTFVGQFGYERVLSVLGRHFRDFINNLDNLHEYLRFSYARMKPPSFFCEKEDENGLTLHYRSKRRGFIWYVFGQIKEVSVHFYGTEIEMELINEEYLFDTVHVVFRLKFDNKAFIENEEMLADHKEIYDPVSGDMFLEIFPFSMVFGEDLVIKTIGKSLAAVLQQTVNRKLTDVFDMIKPLIECSWNTILLHTNNIFELVTIEPILIDESVPDEDDNTSYTGEDLCLHLKGQMIFVQDWDSLVFLGTPVMPNLDILMKSGLFINDLSMHDFSRDLVLAGQQQAAELKLALDQEKTKSRQLHESMKKLDMERERTDLLLYQMIPRQIADRLRKGENSENICEYFDSVTILFSDVVGFTSICSRISPMEVVSMLNGMYSLFDQLTERHKVYKVETIGDAYMVVSGAPTPNDKHAEDICNMALDMVILIEDLKDPSTDEGLKIRVGIHSGAVAAGVVGMKMPRYCLFGDSVNTASKMESSSEKLKIHITEYTKYLLDPSEWIIKERGSITVKGKGKVKTYWLVNSKLERPDPHEGLIMNEEVPDSPTENDRNTESRLSLYTPAIQQIRVVSSTDKEASSISLQNDTVKKDHSNGNNNPNITISEVDTKEDQSIMRSASSSSIFKSSENSKLFKNRSPNTSNKVTPIGSPDNTKNLTEPNLNRVPPTIIKTSDQDDNTSNGDAVNGSKPSLNGKKHVTISGSADKLLKEEAEKMEENFGNPPVVVTESKCLGGKNSSFCALL